MISDFLRASALLLAVCSAVSLVGCSSSTGSDDKTESGALTAVSGTDTETAAETGREAVSDGLPELDFEGKIFRIIVPTYANGEFLAETQNGGLVNDAVFARNLAVKERFNVDFAVYYDDDGEVKNKVSASVTAGDDEYDLVAEHAIVAAQLACANVFYDWNSLEYFNVDQPWWNHSAYENLNVNGKTFLQTGSISLYTLAVTYFVYFNKKITDDYGLTDEIYDTALDGNFTIDYYMSKIKDSWRDLNGNGEADDDDYYGLAANVTSAAIPFQYSFGETTVRNDSDGTPQLSLDTEKYQKIVEKVYSLFYESGGTITTDGWELNLNAFKDERAMFLNGVFQHSYIYLTDFNDDYGIIPYPKWDEQ